MPRLTLSEYATLSLRLATAGNEQASLLASVHLSPQDWDEEVAYWEQQLDEASEQEDELAPLLLEYSEAVQNAQRALAVTVVALQTFSQILAELRGGLPLDQVLRRRQLSLQEFLTAQRQWLERAATDPAVRRALEKGPLP